MKLSKLMEELKETEEELEEIKEKVSSSTDELNDTYNDLDTIKVRKTRGHKADIKLSDECSITMGYPSLDMFVSTNFTDEEENRVDEVFKMAASCIKTIQDPNQVYECADVPPNEIQEFFDDMNSAQFAMVQKFFDTMPKLTHTIKVTNPNTGKESDVVLEGLASFFA